jgi:hypothetical protein
MQLDFWGLVGAIAGTFIGLAGGAFGMWVTYRVRGRSEAQRAFLRRLYVWLVLATLALVAAAWLFSFGRIAPSAYAVILPVWIIGIMALSLWTNVKLDRLGPPPIELPFPQAKGRLAMTAEQQKLFQRLMSSLTLSLIAFLVAVFLVVAKLWPASTLAVSVPLYVLITLGLICRFLRRLGVLKQIHYVFRALMRSRREEPTAG